MAASTGIVLAATGIVVANEWIQSGTSNNKSVSPVNFRVIAAGLLLAAFLGGAEKIPDAKPIAVGLAATMLVTVLVTPLKGEANSPLQTLSNLANGTTTVVTGKKA